MSQDGVNVFCECSVEWRAHAGQQRCAEFRPERVEYLTDNRDERDARKRVKLVILSGHRGGGDWHVVTCPESERGLNAVRLCTSGGAARAVPGLNAAIAQAFRSIVTAHTGIKYE